MITVTEDGSVGQSGRVRVLPGGQRVVEHDPGAAERPGEGLTLARRGVETVVIPELHPASIAGLIAGCGDMHTGRHYFFV